MSVIRVLRTGLGLPVVEKVRFVTACYRLCLCAGRIRIAGLSSTLAYIERNWSIEHTASITDVEQRIGAWHRAVGRAARVLPVGTCLERAVTLQILLGREHIATSLKIGVQPGENALHAHAWLERDGEPLLEQVDPELRRNAFSGPWTRGREDAGPS